MFSKVMLRAWQFILVWDIATTIFVLKFIKNLISCHRLIKSQEKRLPLYRQEVHEIMFARFLVLVFATRDLHNYMCC